MPCCMVKGASSFGWASGKFPEGVNNPGERKKLHFLRVNKLQGQSGHGKLV